MRQYLSVEKERYFNGLNMLCLTLRLPD